MAELAYKVDPVTKEQELIKGFKKALITWQPDIKVFDLTESDKWLILATDGFWTTIPRREVAGIVEKVEKSKQDEFDSVHVVRHLLYTALDRICEKEGYT
eukprot:CAMPEP_0170473126 /NCGR_PEP_ID=MMETSP0123-20130129/15073_1 /TAXON_ID=182087 /ORGANISM="Favella ehrenbergii, Strain Fehren 1" /LENGTH=99 /DNA_ID=CAMNT_0010741917 /DNA_START=752 /DNA_END=1048 /DNA_ORIENTATION=+